MVSSCFRTSLHSVPRTSFGTVVEAELGLLLRSVLGLLPSLCAGAAMPKLSICSFVNRLPQILLAASMPSDASDAVSIDKKNCQIEQDRALHYVLFDTTKLARGIAT